MRSGGIRSMAFAFCLVAGIGASGCGSSSGTGRDAAPPRETGGRENGQVIKCVPEANDAGGCCTTYLCTDGASSWTEKSCTFYACDAPPPPPPPPPPPTQGCQEYVGWKPDKSECDDGNTYGGDCCNALCQIEANCVCDDPRRGPGCINISRCGDAHTTTDEACDDGNTADGDGCSSYCRIVDPGWVCRAAGKACTPICGDRMLLGNEECDDGNTVSGDGCSRYCRKEPGASCPEVGKPCAIAGCGSPGVDAGACDAGPAIGTTCGDGILSHDEECDDRWANDDLAYGGCTTACKLGPHCGDGIVNGSETCDLGSGDPRLISSYGKKGACTATCLATPYCGDGSVDLSFGEECDLGDSNGNRGVPCDSLCGVLDYILDGW